MIKTKRIYDRAEDEDGYRLLTMRKWPRGRRKQEFDAWIPDLGPSEELLEDWRAERITWEEYMRRYIERMQEEAGQALLRQVKELEQEHGVVTLLCWEDLTKPGSHCHREILKDLLETKSPA